MPLLSSPDCSGPPCGAKSRNIETKNAEVIRSKNKIGETETSSDKKNPAHLLRKFAKLVSEQDLYL